MIVKNEEENIVHAIRSIPDHYEIIVVDTGSEDRTKELLLDLNIKVYDYVWNDDFAKARNASISKATGDYILIMDADERILPDADEAIQAFIQCSDGATASVIIENDIGNETTTHRMVRLFPNLPEFSFSGAVHETLYRSGIPAAYIHTNIRISHAGYDPAYYEKRNKADFYLSLYAKLLEETPNDGYLLYQLGKLYFSLRRYAEALAPLERSQQLQDVNALYYPVMLVMLGYTYKELGRSQEAMGFILAYEHQYEDFPDLPFLIGLLAMDTGDIKRIEPSFEQALRIGETTKYTTVAGVGSFKAAYNLGVFHEVTGNLLKAKEFYRYAAALGYGPASSRLRNL